MDYFLDLWNMNKDISKNVHDGGASLNASAKLVATDQSLISARFVKKN